MVVRQGSPYYPQRSFLLAVEAIRATLDHGQPIVPASEQALHDCFAAVQGRLLADHGAGIEAAVFAPDGRLVTAGNDGTARVWDLKDPKATPVVLTGHKGGDPRPGVRPRRPPGHRRLRRDGAGLGPEGPQGHPRRPHRTQGWDPALGFAPDGRLVTAGNDGTARVWDLKDPKATPVVLTGHKRGILALGFAPDGRLVTAGNDGTARVWDLKDPKATPVVLTGHEGGISALGFAPDGRVVTAGNDETARVWDLKDPKATPVVLTGHKGRISALGFAPDGRVVIAGNDGTARVWDLKDPKDPKATPVVLTGHEGWIPALGFAPDGRLVTAGYDGTAGLGPEGPQCHPRRPHRTQGLDPCLGIRPRRPPGHRRRGRDGAGLGPRPETTYRSRVTGSGTQPHPCRVGPVLQDKH